MSRIGKKPIEIPENVTVQFNQQVLSIKGPMGALSREIHPDILLDIDVQWQGNSCSGCLKDKLHIR